MGYLRDMKLFGGTVQMRWSAVALTTALAVSACGSSTADDVAESVTEAADATSTDEASTVAVSLGDREAGYGQGSLAVLAGQYVDRLADVEGDWFPGPPIPLEIPDVCGLPEPAALQGLVLARPVDQTGIRADVISIEVRVYKTAEEAEAIISLVNGDSADDCDRASVELAADSTAPGVSFDFGDGVGQPSPVPDGLPDGLPANSRSYDFEIVFGSVTEPLVQESTVVAEGQAVIAFSVSSGAEDVDELEADLIAALFGQPAPEVIENPDLDVVIDDVRRSVLADSELPDFYGRTNAMVVGGPGEPDVCFTAAPPAAATSGPSWLAVSPNIGASELNQGNRIYADVDAATVAFEEVKATGLECFPEEIQLPDGFEIVSSEAEVLDVDGTQVVHVEIDFVQTLGTQTYDVEAKIAVAQFDEVLTSLRFFGLAGDAPDLPELVAIAAERGSGSDR